MRTLAWVAAGAVAVWFIAACVSTGRLLGDLMGQWKTAIREGCS